MAITTIAHPEPRRLTVGVDTHKDLHVASAKDQLGRRVATTLVPTTLAGYQQLLAWAHGFGEVEAFGVEGTGCYGAALARFLRSRGQIVFEVNRPDRAVRRRRGKSDTVDAEAAARTVQAGEATGMPKAADGTVEMLHCLRVARATAIKARTQAVNAMTDLLVTTPADLREQLRGGSTAKLVRAAAQLAPGALTTPTAAAMLALRTLAERYQALTAEIKTLSAELNRLIAAAAPRLLGLFGVGPDSAGALLVAAGDNPDRLRSDAAFSLVRVPSLPLFTPARTAFQRRPRPPRSGHRRCRVPTSREPASSSRCREGTSPRETGSCRRVPQTQPGNLNAPMRVCQGLGSAVVPERA
jgi:transposase